MSLLLSGAICAFYGYIVLHKKWDDMFEHTLKIVNGAMPALYFLMFTGAISAACFDGGLRGLRLLYWRQMVASERFLQSGCRYL